VLRFAHDRRADAHRPAVGAHGEPFDIRIPHTSLAEVRIEGAVPSDQGVTNGLTVDPRDQVIGSA
jgi:hypothetical protein